MAASNSYGIKEVADVIFYAINDDGTRGAEQFKFDSLKVSNIEVSSEETSARGGQGNPELLSWSYGKEINLTIEDALISLETLQLLFGGSLNQAGDTVTVDASTFPGTYWIEGKTYMRYYTDGQDYLFTFKIPKGKVQANTTLTMEAEGDPSTFEMTIKALRTSNNELIIFEKGNKKGTTTVEKVSANLKAAASQTSTVTIHGATTTSTVASVNSFCTATATADTITLTYSSGNAGQVDRVTVKNGNDTIGIIDVTLVAAE